MSAGDRCGVEWATCPACEGEPLDFLDGESRCGRCGRRFDPAARAPCPDEATVPFTDASHGGIRLCRSHAACAARQMADWTSPDRVCRGPSRGVSVGAFRGQAPVLVVPYDPRWPARFSDERALLEPVLAPFLVGAIEHVGSTAVPGLAAKPVIDLMAPVESLDAARPALPLLAPLGYCFFPYRPDVMHWLCKPSDALRTHHLHLVPRASALWDERIAFRDHLRAHPAIADEYGALKRRLADRYRLDRGAYTDEKSAFVRRVLDLAAR